MSRYMFLFLSGATAISCAYVIVKWAGLFIYNWRNYPDKEEFELAVKVNFILAGLMIYSFALLAIMSRRAYTIFIYDNAYDNYVGFFLPFAIVANFCFGLASPKDTHFKQFGIFVGLCLLWALFIFLTKGFG